VAKFAAAQFGGFNRGHLTAMQVWLPQATDEKREED
jgi:hypothetical protein